MRPCRLAWRVTDLPSMLVLTYRDDELRDDHALRRVLDALARQEVQRVALRPLSAGAVEELSARTALTQVRCSQRPAATRSS